MILFMDQRSRGEVLAFSSGGSGVVCEVGRNHEFCNAYSHASPRLGSTAEHGCYVRHARPPRTGWERGLGRPRKG